MIVIQEPVINTLISHNGVGNNMRNKDDKDKTILRAIQMLRKEYHQKSQQRKHLDDIADLLRGFTCGCCAPRNSDEE